MEEINRTRIGSYGLIITESEKIALVRKAGGGYKGKLDLPGGGMEFKESPEETLKREILEEAGLNISNYELLDVASTVISWQMMPETRENLHQVGILYLIKSEEVKLKDTPDGLDSTGCKWYNIKDLKESELTPFTIYALKKVGYNL